MDKYYTATEIVTFIAAIGVLVTGVGAVIVNIIVALKQSKKTDELVVAVAKVDSKAEIIAGHVNSTATEAKAKIESLEDTIKMMNKTAADIKEAVLLNIQPPTNKKKDSI